MKARNWRTGLFTVVALGAAFFQVRTLLELQSMNADPESLAMTLKLVSDSAEGRPQAVLPAPNRHTWPPSSHALLDALSDGVFKKDDEKEAWSFRHWLPKDADARKLFSNEVSDTFGCLRNKRIFFYGTSFLREIYFDALRFGLGLAELSKVQMYIPSSDDNSRCQKDTGPAGFDLALCGMPHNRSEFLEAYNLTIHFQFKTFLSTEPSDEIVRKSIAESPEYDFLVLGSAEWGSNKFELPLLSYQEQVERFYGKLFKVYRGRKMYVFNNGFNKSTKFQEEHLRKLIQAGDKSILIYDMASILEEVSRNHVKPDGHGYAGPTTAAITWSLLKTMCAD